MLVSEGLVDAPKREEKRPLILRWAAPLHDQQIGVSARKVKIHEYAVTTDDWLRSFERPWQGVTRQFWTRVTLCYISVPGGSLDTRSARNHDWIQTDRVL